MPETPAGRLLRRASEIVDGDRNSQHGNKERSFACIADFWNMWLRHRYGWGKLRASDVAKMQQFLKDARFLYGKPLDDHTIDNLGYGGIFGELVTAETEPDERKWAWDYQEQTEPRDPPPFLQAHGGRSSMIKNLVDVALHQPVTQMAPDTPINPKTETRSMPDTSHAAKATKDPKTETYSSGGETGAAHRQIFTGQECA